MSSEKGTPGSVKLKQVRVRTGGVHYGGARVVSLLTTDKTAVNIASNNTVICDAITTHPAGVLFTDTKDGQTHLIPYANVEVMTVE